MSRKEAVLLVSRALAAIQFKRYDELGIAFNLARIAGLMVFALIFWNCSPWLERFLLPTKHEDTAAPDQR